MEYNRIPKDNKILEAKQDLKNQISSAVILIHHLPNFPLNFSYFLIRNLKSKIQIRETRNSQPERSLLRSAPGLLHSALCAPRPLRSAPCAIPSAPCAMPKAHAPCPAPVPRTPHPVPRTPQLATRIFPEKCKAIGISADTLD